MTKKICITMGDPNGIGAEIIIKAIQAGVSFDDAVIVGSKKILEFYGGSDISKDVEITDIPYKEKDILPSQITSAAGEFSYKCLSTACELAKNEKVGAIVTAPVAKSALHIAGHNFSGQTEVLEKLLSAGGEKAQMLFCVDDLKVLLLTRHVALADVPKLLTKELIVNTIYQTNLFFEKELAIKKPKFALCALNPHAGENGVIGQEETLTFTPALKELKKRCVDIDGVFVADAFFAKIAQKFLAKQILSYDCIFVPYHDQGLIPVKMLAGKRAVNTTIGLPVLRTSPSHGTAFDIAGKNIADPTSMIEAIKLAKKYRK